jgi:hypothetical protein
MCLPELRDQSAASGGYPVLPAEVSELRRRNGKGIGMPGKEERLPVRAA